MWIQVLWIISVQDVLSYHSVHCELGQEFNTMSLHSTFSM